MEWIMIGKNYQSNSMKSILKDGEILSAFQTKKILMNLNKNTTVKTIFFDFDGVLAESLHIKTEAFQKMYLKYGEEFSLKVRDHHIKNGGVSRYEKFKIYNGEWLGQEINELKIEELANEFSSLVVNGVINSYEVKGSSDFLNDKSTLKYRKYIITGTPTEEIKRILKGRKMEHHFKASYGSPEKKDYWVEKILREESLDPNNCIFIGDAMADYKAAIANNVEFILRETEEGKNLFHDFQGYRINDLTSLKETIKKIENSKV